MVPPSLAPSPPSRSSLTAAFRRLALAVPLGLVPGWWLLLRCDGCGYSVHLPLKMLVERHGDRLRLGSAVDVLRCKRCRVPPVEVVLTDDPQAGAHGGPPATWRLPLVPAELRNEPPEAASPGR